MLPGRARLSFYTLLFPLFTHFYSFLHDKHEFSSGMMTVGLCSHGEHDVIDERSRRVCDATISTMVPAGVRESFASPWEAFRTCLQLSPSHMILISSLAYHLILISSLAYRLILTAFHLGLFLCVLDYCRLCQ